MSENEIKTLRLSDAAEARLAELLQRYPSKKSAVMPALAVAQEELGWLSSDAIRWVSERLGLAPAHVYEVADGKQYCSAYGTWDISEYEFWKEFTSLQ